MALGAVGAIAAIAIAAPEAATRAAVVSIVDPATPDAAARAVRDGVGAAFARAAAYGGVKVVDEAAVASTLSGADEKARATKLAAALEQAKRGRALYAQLEFERAAKELEAARDALLPLLAAKSAGALVDVLLDLGQDDLDLHRADAAREAFRQARIYGAPATLPPSYAPKTAAAYRDATASLAPRAGATLAVASDPGGASIAIDGRTVGVAPVLVADLVDGPHVVRAELPGAAPAIAPVTLAHGRTTHVSLALATLPDDAAQGIPLGTPESELSGAIAIGRALDVEFVVATHVTHAADGPHLRTMLVDVKRELLIGAPSTGGDPTLKATLDKAGTTAGDLLRQWQKTAPPTPAPPALQFTVQ